MAIEIERKFLVITDAWRPDPARGTHYRQGYLSSDPSRTVRVRLAGDKGFLTVKGRTRGIERLEFEFPIPPADAERMLDRLCLHPLVEKTRYREIFANKVWEVDVFEGENSGLVMAEVELPTPSTAVVLPPWAGREVSDDPRYFNSNLARHPFSAWPRDG